MACITEGAAGFPGFSARIPFENGFASEVLGERGWNTYAVGKWHLTPSEESDLSAWKRRWPLGRGFERFYGFLGGETHQWYPDLVYDNHPIDQPYTPEEGYHLSKDLVDKGIEFVRDARSVAPDKPWYMYFCPGCAHAPHHVFEEWSERYRGRFDEGYEEIRGSILARQKELGLLPDERRSLADQPARRARRDRTGRPALARPRLRATLGFAERRRATAVLPYGGGIRRLRLLHRPRDRPSDRLSRGVRPAGQHDHRGRSPTTASSAEGGPNGSFNENKFFNGVPDSIEDNMKHLDELGTPASYNHYCSGWAWAFDTPFPYWKRYAGYEGGTADMCVVAWPKGISARGEVRDQYVHAVDVVPTLYELIGIEPPEVIGGYEQSPIEGESFAASLSDPAAAGKETQFFSMLGQRAVYHRGWLANTLHPPISGWGNFDDDEWELYHLAEDRSQMHNLAAEHPERLERAQGALGQARRRAGRHAARRPLGAGDSQHAQAAAGGAA